MADIFREVDEEVRRERAVKIWRKYQAFFIIAAVLIVAGTGGWRFYVYHTTQQAEAAGRSYEAALQLVSDGKSAQAEAAFADLVKGSVPGYALLARLRLAETIAIDDPATAVKNFDAIAADATVPQPLQDIARLRAAMLLVDTTSLADMRNRLVPLTQDANAFRNSAREMLAISALKADDFTDAGNWLDAIVTDAATPQDMRDRANQMLGVVAAGTPSGDSPAAATSSGPATAASPSIAPATAPATIPPAGPAMTLPSTMSPTFTLPGPDNSGFALPLSAQPTQTAPVVTTAPPASATSGFALPLSTSPAPTGPADSGAPAAVAPAQPATAPAAPAPAAIPDATAPAAASPPATTSPTSSAPVTPAPGASSPAQAPAAPQP